MTRVFFCQGKRKTHKHKQICGIVPGLGGRQNLVYVFFLFGPFLMGEKTHKQNPPKIQGQSRENIVYVLCLYVFLFLPILSLFWHIGQRRFQHRNLLKIGEDQRQTPWVCNRRLKNCQRSLALFRSPCGGGLTKS